MIEAKGERFTYLLQRGPPIEDNVIKGWLKQAEDQVNAAGPRGIEWFFAEQEAAKREIYLFDASDRLRKIKNNICSTPDGTRKSAMRIETNPTNSKNYFVSCSWERRAETPEQIAARFWRMIDCLQRIDPVFRAWDCGGPPAKPLESVRDDYAREVAEGMFLDDWGKPHLNYGYWLSAWTRDVPRNQCFVVRCLAGSTVRSAFPNSVILETAAPREVGPDPSVVGYELFRAALLCIGEAWAKPIGRAPVYGNYGAKAPLCTATRATTAMTTTRSAGAWIGVIFNKTL